MPFTQDDLNKFKNLYIETAQKYLEDMRQHLFAVKQGENTSEEIHEILIAAHSLGGQSHIAGYEQIARLCSKIQEICIKTEEAKAPLGENIVPHMERGIQKMLDSIAEIEKGGEELDLSEELKNLKFEI